MENHLDEKLIFREDGIQARQSLAKMAKYDFYQNENWFEEMCEILFKIKRRKSSIKSEIYYGLIHFISCLYVLAVVPQQLEPAGYRYTSTICAVAACSGAGSIVCGLFANLPFVLAPPTVVSIFLSVFLLQYGYGTKTGNISVIISGFLLMLFGWRPLGNLFARLVPMPIQAGTAIGIGLLTALAGSTEIGLVVQGKYNVLKMGELTSEVIIAIFGVLLVCIAMIYHVKGSFCLAVIVCSLLWWTTENAFPTSIASAPHADLANLQDIHWTNVPLLTADLIFLYFLYLNGLVPTLAQQADLTREDNSIPRGRWLFIMAGFFTILGGLFCSAPVLISPESSGGIKAGAKTGLSTVVAGILFLISLFFSPILEKIPSAATGPLLIVIGILLFNNVSRINWRSIKEAAPAFIVLFYIPFTYSIIQGNGILVWLLLRSTIYDN